MVSWQDFEWFGHHKLLRIVKFEGKVVNDEPLRVGAGRAAAIFEPVDLVVVKIYDPVRKTYVPYIPGSSWKGVFRAHAVRVSRAQGVAVCDGVPGASCLEGNEFYEYERAGIDFRGKVELIMKGEVRTCLLCLMFGAPSIYSHVMFKDSLPTNAFTLGYRTMTAIDRRTGTVRRGALFTVEYVEPGCTFGFSMEAINLPNYAIGLLMKVVKDINLGVVRVGGLKTRGFGRVHFENVKLSTYPLVKDYGIVDGVLKALDPIDTDVEWGSKEVIEGREAWGVIESFIKSWDNALPKLRKISESGWRWEVIA